MLNKKFFPFSILLSLLLFILAGCGCSIETVDEHNSRIAGEALERSSILSEMSDNENTSDAESTDKSGAAEVENSSDDTSSAGETSDNAIYGTNGSLGTAGDNSTENTYSYDNSIDNTSRDTNSSGNTSVNDSTAGNENTTSKSGNSNAKQTSALQSTNKPANTASSSTVSGSAGGSSAVNNSETTAFVPETETTAKKPLEETTTPYIKVHITISCSKVIGNENLSTNADLPGDGIILDTYIAVRDNDSVFTALKAAADDNGIQLSYTGSKSAVYISGIGGLYEKECGRYSGWKYSVNSVYPNVGCGGYSLSDGDNIFFGYVANYNDTY